MFCLMDVSASMDEDKKDLAKRFFTLLYLFLTRKYEQGRPRLHPPHRRRRGSRRGDVLPRPRIRRHGRAVSALELMDRDHRASAIAERTGTSTARRPPTATPWRTTRRAARASCARSCCRWRATTPTSSWRPRTRRASTCGPSTSALPRRSAQLRDAPGVSARRRSTRCSATCSGRKRKRMSAVPEPLMRPTAVCRTAPDWDFELLERYDAAIARHRRPTSASTPTRTRSRSSPPSRCWTPTRRAACRSATRTGRYGKEFIRNEQTYRRGMQGLAYEIVINSNPCIAYLMEENTMAMQALVIAHAAYGHNSLLQGQLPVPAVDRRRRDHRLPGLRAQLRRWSARSATAPTAVEEVLDSCHALMNHGVDRYRRPAAAVAQGARQRACAEREAHRERQFNDLWRTRARARRRGSRDGDARRFPAEPQENLLYFIEKNSPLLEPWQRELVRIVRKLAQYFYPQRQTQVMNEGWATFWHYTLAQPPVREGPGRRRLHDRVPEDPHQRRLPAAVRLAGTTAASTRTRWASRCSRDLRRICEKPDRRGPRVVPRARRQRLARRRSTSRCATSRTRASSRQYLSPQLMREFRLFAVADHDERGRARGRQHPRRARLPARAQAARASSTRRRSACPTSRSCATTATATAR